MSSTSVDLGKEIQDIERLLSRPGALPGEFTTWIVYWLTQNIDISSYQLRGLASTFFKAATPVGPEASTGNGYMTSLPGGPILEGIPNGRYLAFWGSNFATQGGDSVGLMGCSPNGIVASDEQAAKGRTIDDSDFIPMFYTREFTLTNDDNNYLEAQYMRAAGGVPRFQNRWLCAVKVAKAA